VELAADARRLPAHPEQHPGHDRRREDHGQPFEELLVWLVEAADRREQDDPDDRRQPECQPGSDEHVREVALVAGLGQVGADDGEDERRLDAFAKAGQQAAGERAEVHRGRTPSIQDKGA
jgi:hypothetical protein